MALSEHPSLAPTPTAPQPTPPGKQPSALFKHVVSHAHRLDRLIARLSTIFSSPASTDALLGTLSYTLELLAALISRLLARRLTSIASAIAEKADEVLLPGETLVTTLPTTSGDEVLAQVATGSKALAAVIADYRIFARLWGLAGLYTWARATWNAPVASDEGTKTKVVRRITWAQIASLAIFQVLENGAYLASKGVLTGSGWSGEAGKRKEVTWWVWSCRFWAAHVALELLRVAVLRYYQANESSVSQEKELIADGEKEGKLLAETKRRERWAWWRDLVSNIAYMPMTLHWSVEEKDGFLSDWGVGLLGAIAAGTMLVDVWKQTA